MSDLSLSAKVTLFRSLFSGLQHAYGTYHPQTKSVWVVKKPVTNQVIRDHLTGKQPYGVFLLFKHWTKASVVDFDIQDTSLPIAFVNRAKHYGLPAYIECSKSKGYHVWWFCQEPGVMARKSKRVIQHILQEIECPPTEIFPKQDEINESKTFGNFINTPLFGALVPQGKTVFVNPENGMKPYRNQWQFLQTIQKINACQIDDVIEINELSQGELRQSPLQRSNSLPSSFGLLPCAKRMLSEGVATHQRVSCFRLAVHLKRLGISYEYALAILKMWAMKNQPQNGKRVITQTEIESQVRYAFEHAYTSYGCETPEMASYCSPHCPVFKKINTIKSIKPNNQEVLSS